jgi:hypothetical protein
MQNKFAYDGFVVDTTKISQIITESSINYTLRLIGDNVLIQENLVVSQKFDGDIELYKTKYNLTNEQLFQLNSGSLSNLKPSEVSYISSFNSTTSIPIFGDGAECAELITSEVGVCQDAYGNWQTDNGDLGNGCSSNWMTVTVLTLQIDPGCLTPGGGSSGGGSTGGGSTGGGSTGGGSNDGSGSKHPSYAKCKKCK